MYENIKWHLPAHEPALCGPAQYLPRRNIHHNLPAFASISSDCVLVFMAKNAWVSGAFKSSKLIFSLDDVWVGFVVG